MDSEDLVEVRNPYPPKPQGGRSTWYCLACMYNLNTGENCINCGRDRWGTDPGPGAPSVKPHRPGLRGGK